MKTRVSSRTAFILGACMGMIGCSKLTEPPKDETPPAKQEAKAAATASAAPPPAAPAVPGAKLEMTDIVVGKGAEAKAGDTVRVHYVGKLTNGTEFDASRKHGDDGFTFPLGAGQVIKGWDQGVSGMKVGGKRRLKIPPELGYGKRGAGPIPPDSTLDFEVELLEIVKK